MAASVCLTTFVSAPVIAQTSARTCSDRDIRGRGRHRRLRRPSAPAKIYTVTTGLDFTSAYLFRGIPQKSGGAIGQPYADVAFAFKHGITADVGTWNSIHSTADRGELVRKRLSSGR